MFINRYRETAEKLTPRGFDPLSSFLKFRLINFYQVLSDPVALQAIPARAMPFVADRALRQKRPVRFFLLCAFAFYHFQNCRISRYLNLQAKERAKLTVTVSVSGYLRDFLQGERFFADVVFGKEMLDARRARAGYYSVNFDGLAKRQLLIYGQARVSGFIAAGNFVNQILARFLNRFAVCVSTLSVRDQIVAVILVYVL